MRYSFVPAFVVAGGVCLLAYTAASSEVVPLFPPDMGYADATGRQAVPCPNRANTAVLLAAGQSNMGNHAGGPAVHAPVGVFNLNPYDGRCYRAEDPLFGATGDRGNPLTRVGERLLLQGDHDAVVLANVAVGGTFAREWVPGAPLFHRIEAALKLMSALGLPPTHLLWQHGEAEILSPPNVYREQLDAIFGGIRDAGYAGPIYVARTSRCNLLVGAGFPDVDMSRAARGREMVRETQAAVVSQANNILAGPDTDVIQGDGRDWYQCHFSGRGADIAGQLWTDAILGGPRSSVSERITIVRSRDFAWKYGKDVDGVHVWHPWISETRSQGSEAVAATRELRFRAGGALNESVTLYDYVGDAVETRSTSVDTPALPARRVWTRLEYKAGGSPSETVVTWTVDYDPARGADPNVATEVMRRFVHDGLVGLKAFIEKYPEQ